MKKLLCLLCCVTVACLLCACSWLDKEYVSIRDYTASEQEEDLSGGRLTVHSYSALRSALLGMTYEGRTEGSIVFDPAYEGDTGEDMEKACRELRTEDALCAYCVENIAYEFNKIVTINEVNIRISYSRVSENPKHIVHLGFSTEAEPAILNAMQRGMRSLTLLVARSGYSAEDMAAQVVKTYRDHPTVVPKEPEALVNVFSGAGTQRLYEIQIDYGMTTAMLWQCRIEMDSFAPFDELDSASLSEVERAYAACRYLLENCDFTEDAADNSAYSALIQHRANDEGTAFAYVELCRQLDLDCRIVYGQHDWADHCWNIVRMDDSYYHVDITQCARGGPALGFMQNDESFWGSYRWDVASYPKCTGTRSFFDFFPPSGIEAVTGDKTA